LNFDAVDDKHSDETWERTFGPNYYSFDYGPTHFIVLDDVTWLGAVPGGTGAQFGGKYQGGFGAQQLEWLRNDLAQIPADQMVVLFMHIPLADPADVKKKDEPGAVERFHSAERRQLWEMLEKRPATLSISAHTHFQEHRFVTKEEGWNGPEAHHHVINVTVSGSWWSGEPDEKGIPHTTMRDGAPNGYSFLNFDGKKYWIEYKAARHPADYQMAIYAPDEIAVADAAKTEVLVNVFAGSERSKVEMKLGDNGAWIPMKQVRRVDPAFAAMKAKEKQEGAALKGRALPGMIESPHLWAAMLPADVKPGAYEIQVRTTDLWGKVYNGKRAILVK
jgi:3',5'-cyclic AMP phosphodiesterase CpdA